MDEPEGDLLKALKNLLKSLEASLNVKEKLEDHQAFEIVVEIAREYKYLTLNEFIYCFRKAKLGHYGKDYNRMDILSISTWLREYSFSSERTATKKEIENKKKWDDIDKTGASDPPPEFYQATSREKEIAAGKTIGKMISIKGFAQSQYHRELKEQVPYYSDENLLSLRASAIEKEDHETAEIIDVEMFQRNKKDESQM